MKERPAAAQDGESEDFLQEGPRLEHFPPGQIHGDAWVIGVLDDLIAYSDHRQMGDLGEALRRTQAIAVRSLLH